MAYLPVFNDLIYPLKLALASGLVGRVMRKNQRQQAPNGQQRVNVLQGRSLRTFQWGTTPVKIEVWQTLEGLFEVTDAGAYGFLLEAPNDTAVNTGLLQPYTTLNVGSIGVGYGVPSYRLYKRYSALDSTRTKDRIVTRPQQEPLVKRGGSTLVYGASAGNIAMDYDTGTVTFVADASQAISSITPGATTVINFASGSPIVAAFSVGQRVYLSGITGTIAGTLNGLSHAVTAKGATSLTISTVTTGLTGTGGTAFKFPQSSEALTWTGKMYVPVHFTEDNFDWSMVRPGSLEGNRLFIGPSVNVEEVWEGA